MHAPQVAAQTIRTIECFATMLTSRSLSIVTMVKHPADVHQEGVAQGVASPAYANMRIQMIIVIRLINLGPFHNIFTFNLFTFTMDSFDVFIEIISNSKGFGAQFTFMNALFDVFAEDVSS